MSSIPSRLTFTPQDTIVVKRNGSTAYEALDYGGFAAAVNAVANASHIQSTSLVAIVADSFVEDEGFLFLDYATNPGAVTVTLPTPDHTGQTLYIVAYVTDGTALTSLTVNAVAVTPLYDIAYVVDDYGNWIRF